MQGNHLLKRLSAAWISTLAEQNSLPEIGSLRQELMYRMMMGSHYKDEQCSKTRVDSKMSRITCGRKENTALLLTGSLTLSANSPGRILAPLQDQHLGSQSGPSSTEAQMDLRPKRLGC